MKIGIDFDNTIIDYGDLFYNCAINQFGMPSNIIAEKSAIRSYFWSLPGGNTLWTELQGIVYGEKILEAVPSSGLDEFLNICNEHQVPWCIISHKSEFPALGTKVNLREAAFEWLTANNFFAPSGFGLKRSSVFFETTKNFKLMRIETENCSLFIDDLPDIFNDAHFPANVIKILYTKEDLEPKDVTICKEWESIVNSIGPLISSLSAGRNR